MIAEEKKEKFDLSPRHMISLATLYSQTREILLCPAAAAVQCDLPKNKIEVSALSNSARWCVHSLTVVAVSSVQLLVRDLRAKDPIDSSVTHSPQPPTTCRARHPAKDSPSWPTAAMTTLGFGRGPSRPTRDGIMCCRDTASTSAGMPRRPGRRRRT